MHKNNWRTVYVSTSFNQVSESNHPSSSPMPESLSNGALLLPAPQSLQSLAGKKGKHQSHKSVSLSVSLSLPLSLRTNRDSRTR